MRGVQPWRDVRIWDDAGPPWFHASHAEHPCVSRDAGDLSCVFPSLFCRPSSSLRPIQSLTSGKGRSSRPIYRGALILRVACRKFCRNLERASVSIWQPRTRSERMSWATKQRSLAVVCEDRQPLTCGPLTTAAYWFMKRLIARGNFAVSKTSAKLRNSF
jgi:hypothetical protein